MNNKLNLFNVLKAQIWKTVGGGVPDISNEYIYVNKYFYNEFFEYLVRKGGSRPRNPPVSSRPPELPMLFDFLKSVTTQWIDMRER